MEGAQDISYFSLAIGYLLLIIPIVIFSYYKTGLVKSTITSHLRMTIQLLLVGYYLKYIFALDLWWVNLLWGILMVLVATLSSGQRSNMSKKVFIIPIFVSTAIAMIIIDAFFLGLVIKLPNLFAAMYFVPITGMILGNCLKNNVIALNSYYKNLYKDRGLYRFLITNGATREEALKPYMREALRLSFNPTIASTAVIGLVALPGMMTGQMLGGSSPNVAIKYQIMLVITIFVASVITVFLTIIIVNRFAFDKYDKLKVKYFDYIKK